MSTANDAIEILQGALILADFLEKEEREQILRRMQQLQRRHEDPRTFIAFVGEKKAGKSSLLKTITGVPLPTAVRECTAAVCLIQLGLDWHHLAKMDSGERRSFEALDDSSERRVLRKAKKNDKAAAEAALAKIEQAEEAHRLAKSQVQETKDTLDELQNQLNQSEQVLKETEENLPFLWDVWKNFGWISPKVKHIQASLEESANRISETNQAISDTHSQLEEQHKLEQSLAMMIPERWKEAKEAATVSKEQVDLAKRGLQDIARANKDKFHTELHSLIDVDAEAAAQVDILTPSANIPTDVVLLDTPGFNTELPEHRRRAWEAIEEKADICILVSDIRQPMPETALKMLRRITPFCPFMHLALTKSDLALKEASILQEDPQQEILEAKHVAKSRVEPYWDGEMNIWVVSAEGDQRKQSQRLFTEFWDSIPPMAHELKTKKLSIHAIGELIDILDVHILLEQETLRAFDLEATSVLQQLFDTVEGFSSAITPLIQDLLNNIRTQVQSKWGQLEQQWILRIQQCRTKSDIKMVFEAIQSEMNIETNNMSAHIETALLEGCKRIASHLAHQHPLDMNSLLNFSIQRTTTNESNATLWATAGGLAGVATGLLLNGSLTGTLLLALGTGGITTLLLSPLAEGKSKAEHAITEGVRNTFNHVSTQLDQFPSTLEQECSRLLQEQLQNQLEEKRAIQRQNHVRKIQRVQDIQTRLEEAKFNFWPQIQSTSSTN